MTNENTELLKSYQKILKLCTEHMGECADFENKIIKEFDFEEEIAYGPQTRTQKTIQTTKEVER